MSKKFFKPIAIGGATAILAITSFLSYAIGLIRDRIIAVHFGTSAATDTYNASFLIPDMLFNLFIAGALAAAFLPIFTEYLVKDKQEAYKIANTMLNSAIIVIVGLSVLAFIFMNEIINFSFQEATPQMQKDIIGMTRLMLISAVVFAISNTIGNILMTYKHFLAYSLSPILYNLGIILGVIFFQDTLGIYAAALGVIFGAIIHCAVRVWDLKYTEYRYKAELHWKHPGFIQILKLMLPKAISLLVWQINLYIFTDVGIRIKEGGVAAFNFARNIQSFAVSLFGISLATAVFPYLTSSMSSGDQASYTEHVQKTIQRILFFTIPSTIGLMILARPVVELILSGGAFDENSVHLTSLILFFFAISIPFESLSHILARAFYALKNTVTPMIINIVSMAIIAFCTIYLAPRFGIEWFSIGFSIGFIFFVIMTGILLKKHLKGFKIKQFFVSFGKTIVATGIMAIVLITSTGLENLMSLKLAHVARIILGSASFFITAAIFKSSEISNINYIVNKFFKKPVDEKQV